MKTAFVGAGDQGLTNLLPALMQVSRAHVTSVCDPNAARAERGAKLAGSAKAYTNFKDLLDRDQPEAIVMACPPAVHREVALAAMARGVHVFVEKPPCVTSPELHELIEVADKSGVVTGVGLNFRFAAPVLRVIDIIGSDRFGPLVHFEIKHPANKPKSPMWEADSTIRSFLLAQTIHSIDLALRIGGRLEHVDADVRELDGGSLLARINFQFAGGVTGSLLTGNIFPYFDLELMAVGENSSVVNLDKMWNVTVRDSAKDSVFATDGKRWRDVWHPSPLDSGYARSGYLGELEAFFEAIESKQRFAADFSSVAATFDVIDLVSRSTPSARLDGLHTSAATTHAKQGSLSHSSAKEVANA